MARKKSWTEKLAGGKPAHVVVLEKPFAGLMPGQRLFVADPRLLSAEIAGLAPGATEEVKTLRDRLARRHGADATCPVSTAIFLRIVAEAALEEMSAGRSPAEVAPFWRVVEPDSPLARKLSCGPDFIVTQREMEAARG